jgi:hypothetical protein
MASHLSKPPPSSEPPLWILQISRIISQGHCVTYVAVFDASAYVITLNSNGALEDALEELRKSKTSEL